MQISYLDPNFNISRKRYIGTIIGTYLIALIFIGFIYFLIQLYPEYLTPFKLAPLFALIATTIYIQIIAAISRTRDIGISPFWNILFLLPIVNFLYATFLIFKKGVTGHAKLDEKKAYALISDEIDSDTRNKGLWLKAYQLSKGDDTKTKIKYIQLRMEELREIENQKADEKNKSESAKKITTNLITALIVIALISTAFTATLTQSIAQNDAHSADINPLPFSFKSSYAKMECTGTAFPKEVTLEDITNRIKENNNINDHAQLVEYYLYSDKKDFKKAHEIMNDRIEKRAKWHSFDLNQMGKLYECGYSVEKDINKAISYYEQAKSYIKISEIYSSGKDIPANDEKSFDYLKKHSELINDESILAGHYYYGLGVEKNLRKSFQLIKRKIDAAEEKSSTALIDDYFNIGFMYYYGFGTFKNDAKAAKYFKKASQTESSADYSDYIKTSSQEFLRKLEKFNE